MANWQREADKAARKHGVDPKVLRKLISAESGGNPNAKSPMGAQGLAQFMPATAKSYGVNLNDNRISDDLDGAARYLADNLKRTGGDYRAALSIYNSGKPDGYKTIPETRAYVQKILGGPNPSASPSTGAQRPTTRTTTTTAAGPSEAEQRSSVLSSYLATRGQPGALLGLGVGLGNIQAPAVTTHTTGSPTVRAIPAVNGGGGRVKITGPNPSRIKPSVLQFARKISAQLGGKSIVGSDGTGHSRLTVNGNVSQHSTGNATDIPARGADLIRKGQAALIAAGMPRAQALKQRGGLFNVGGHQIIFNTHEGGDHTDHLHISAR